MQNKISVNKSERKGLALPKQSINTGSSLGPGELWHDYFSIGGELPGTGDFNGDGKADIITFVRVDLGDIWVATSTGKGFGPSARWQDWFAPFKEPPQPAVNVYWHS